MIERNKSSLDNSSSFPMERIEGFRKLIVENNDYNFNKFKNVNGKNYWNIICSCMDWITVAVNYLERLEIEDSNENVMSMNVYSMISAYDLIVDSVIQLSRVIHNNSNDIFKDDKDIFHQEISDYKYFKMIRAIFGAHPVNLKNVLHSDKDKKYYASWSSSRIGGAGSMTVFLYSNSPDDTAIEFRINLKELQQFAMKYYNYIDQLAEKIAIV